MKAIETEYRGFRFRSRLEARWAVFLDSLDVEWQYEPEGFTDGTVRYLPDFFLPKLGLWVEVKGSKEAYDRDVEKMLAFCRGQPHKRLLILGEVPDGGNAAVTFHWMLDGDETAIGAFAPDLDKPIEAANFVFAAAVVDRSFRSVLRALRPWMEDDFDYTKAIALRSTDVNHLGGYVWVGRAYLNAKKARFEHGADPRPDHWKAPS